MLNFSTFPIMKKKQIRDSSLIRKVLLKHCRVSESAIKRKTISIKTGVKNILGAPLIPNQVKHFNLEEDIFHTLLK